MLLVVALGFLQSLLFKGNCPTSTMEGIISVSMLVTVNFLVSQENPSFANSLVLRAGMHLMAIGLGLLQVLTQVEELRDENEVLISQRDFLTGLVDEFLGEDRRLGLLILRRSFTQEDCQVVFANEWAKRMMPGKTALHDFDAALAEFKTNGETTTMTTILKSGDQGINRGSTYSI